MRMRIVAISMVLLLAVTSIGIATAANEGALSVQELTGTPGTPTPCAIGTPSGTAEATATGTTEATPTGTATSPGGRSGRGTAQVAARIAEAFCVTVEEVQALHEDGSGFGEIGIAYALAEATGLSVEELIARHDAGEGWGAIAHDLGYQVHGGGAKASVTVWKHADTTPTPGTGTEVAGQTLQGGGKGNKGGNGNGHGNGGNGNGGGNGGNGGGNGGNGGGNGGGHGGGKP